MSWLSNLESVIQKDEQWVVGEIRKGWALVQSAEHQAEIDVLNIFHWISAHQGDILNLMHNVLTDIQVAASAASVVFPQYGIPIAAAVAAANKDVQAAAAAVNVLAQGIAKGSTPMSTVVSAYQKTKDAASAVNSVLKNATTQPAPTS